MLMSTAEEEGGDVINIRSTSFHVWVKFTPQQDETSPPSSDVVAVVTELPELSVCVLRYIKLEV